jgi:putative membrane protein
MVDQWSHILNFLLYLGVSLPLLAIAGVIFMKITSYNESKLIGDGKALDNPRKFAAAQAAAYTLGGKFLGLSLVLASAIFHSVNIIDLAIWGCIGIVSQVIIFFLYELVTPFKIIKEIPEGNISVGILSAFLSVSIGLLLASLISY